MRFRKLISGTCRVDAGEWLDTDEDSAWYAGLREAVQRCRDADDTRHVAYEDFDAAGRALVDNGVARILTAMKDSAFVPKWARLELHKAFVISYDAEAEVSSHAEHTDPGSDVTINCPLTPDDEYEGGELMLRLFPTESAERGNPVLTPPGDWGYGETYDRFEGCLAEIPVPGEEGVRLWKDDLAWIDHRTGRMRGRGVIVGIKTGVHGLVARVKLMHEDVRSLQRRSTAWGEFIPHEQRVVECPVRQVQLIYPSKDVTPRRGAVVVHGGGIQHGARSLTRGARSALILWTKRICSFDVNRLPDDVRRKMLPYWTWRDQLALAAASKGSRRIVATCWSRLRPHMAQRVVDDSNPAVRRKLFGKTAPDIDRLRSVIASAPPGRDPIAGTVATLVEMAYVHVQGLPSSMLFHTRYEIKCRLVQAALARLVHECDDQKCRHRPWDMWFDQSLVKDGIY